MTHMVANKSTKQSNIKHKLHWESDVVSSWSSYAVATLCAKPGEQSWNVEICQYQSLTPDRQCRLSPPVGTRTSQRRGRRRVPCCCDRRWRPTRECAWSIHSRHRGAPLHFKHYASLAYVISACRVGRSAHYSVAEMIDGCTAFDGQRQLDRDLRGWTYCTSTAAAPSLFVRAVNGVVLPARWKLEAVIGSFTPR